MGIRADEIRRRKRLPRARIPSALVLLVAAKSKVARSLPPNSPDPKARPKVAATVLGLDSKWRTDPPLNEHLVQRLLVAEIRAMSTRGPIHKQH